MKPCEKCPWMQKGQPDLTEKVRAAAVAGAWFCCHVHMGTCHGARIYGEAKQVFRESGERAPTGDA